MLLWPRIRFICRHAQTLAPSLSSTFRFLAETAQVVVATAHRIAQDPQCMLRALNASGGEMRVRGLEVGCAHC